MARRERADRGSAPVRRKRWPGAAESIGGHPGEGLEGLSEDSWADARYDEAIAAYREALRIRPDEHLIIWFSRGVWTFGHGRLPPEMRGYLAVFVFRATVPRGWLRSLASDGARAPSSRLLAMLGWGL